MAGKVQQTLYTYRTMTSDDALRPEQSLHAGANLDQYVSDWFGLHADLQPEPAVNLTFAVGGKSTS